MYIIVSITSSKSKTIVAIVDISVLAPLDPVVSKVFIFSFCSYSGSIETWEQDQHRDIDWVESPNLRYNVVYVLFTM